MDRRTAPTTPQEQPPIPPVRAQVVVVGSGFAGLTVARRLKRVPVDVLLLDQHNYHLFTPLLYQVASSLLNPSEIAQPVRRLVRGISNCEFRMAHVVDVDLHGRRIITDRGAIAYDYLVLAAGSVSNYFGNESMAQHSLALKSLPDALALRNWVLQRFELATWEEDPGRRGELITFAVVGGGPTGVEYAGALVELIGLVLSQDFRRVDISAAQVLLVEAAGELLGGFKPRLRQAALRSLSRRGVKVLLNSSVDSIGQDQLVLADGRVLRTGSVVWTAGVRGAPLGATLGVPLDRLGRVRVSPTLQIADHPEAMVIGDLAAQDDLPMLARVAIQQARLVAANIRAMTEGRVPAPFRYRDRGIMATVGRNSAIAEIGPLQFSGFIGWVLWLVVHLVNILTFRARLLVLLNWAWDYLTVDRPIRLLVRAGTKSPLGDLEDTGE